jgi:hypothetical protein
MFARLPALRSRNRRTPDTGPVLVSRTLVLVTLAEMLTEAEAAHDVADDRGRAAAETRATARRDARDRLVGLLVAPDLGP